MRRGPSGRWRGCTPLGSQAPPAAGVRAPSAASNASASQARWPRGLPSSSATAARASSARAPPPAGARKLSAPRTAARPGRAAFASPSLSPA
eukprot:6724996-Prymnesium_polylepis.1